LDIKETIKRLLATAHNEASSDQEIETALRTARGLMFKYQLDETDIESHILEHERKQDKKTTSDYAAFGKRLSSWEITLSSYINKFVGGIFIYYENDTRNARQFGKAVLVNGLPRESQHLVFCGPDELVNFAIDLYKDLSTICCFMVRTKYGSVFVGEGRAYCDGFVTALFNKLDKIDRLEDNRNALILIGEKQREIKKWLTKEKGLRFQDAKPRNLKNYDHAWSEGYQDGNETDVNGMAKSRDKKRLN